MSTEEKIQMLNQCADIGDSSCPFVYVRDWRTWDRLMLVMQAEGLDSWARKDRCEAALAVQTWS